MDWERVDEVQNICSCSPNGKVIALLIKLQLFAKDGSSVVAEIYSVSYGANLLEEFTMMTAIMSNPLYSSYMCKNPYTILKLSLGLEPIVFSPCRG